MRKVIGPYEQKRRQYRKMLNSLSNKMNGNNSVWFDSLSREAQYALLFKYIEAKNESKFKFKHFVTKFRPLFTPSLINSRNAVIDHLIE